MPATPDAFEAELQSKSFANGRDDRPRVAGLYRSAFAQRFGTAERLAYSSLGWGDEQVEQFAAVLASCVAPRAQLLDLGGNRAGDEGAARLAAALGDALPQLRVLVLGLNRVGDGGAARLAAALGALPQLRELYLGSNRVGDEGAARLAAALGALPSLQVLSLCNNRVGDEGAACLAEALRAPAALPMLRLLGLSGNRVGGAGAARLAAALRAPEALPSLQLLDLQCNPLGEGARAALRAAWAEAGRPEGGGVEVPSVGAVPAGLWVSRPRWQARSESLVARCQEG